MKLLRIVLATAVAVGLVQGEIPEWHPPHSGDLRGPCPALNSLVNHDSISRDGKQLTVPVLIKAINEQLNISVEMANTLATAGLSTASNPQSGTFSMADLTKHHIIEHDASLSRKDAAAGDNYSFSKEIFEEFLSYFP